MSAKLNCWEYLNCGREKGGLLVEMLGECPVATAMKYDGIHDGKAAGRICWVVRNSSGNRAQSTDLSCPNCHACAFYRRVLYEEADNITCRFASAAV
ncbi:MAG TPA: hypothetical protein VMY05_04300 [Acidobacteriota bacterium]|nr:hypothetical protein [Acidobacteriota bacterium]